jgi:hypothetical protein
MELLVVLVPIWGVMAVFGAWVAMQKQRTPVEGFLLGILFGPIAALIAALLPRRRSLDERGQIAYLETRYRELLYEADLNWRRLSYHRRQALMIMFYQRLMEELKPTPSQFDDLSVEAKRSILDQK